MRSLRIMSRSASTSSGESISSSSSSESSSLEPRRRLDSSSSSSSSSSDSSPSESSSESSSYSSSSSSSSGSSRSSSSSVSSTSSSSRSSASMSSWAMCAPSSAVRGDGRRSAARALVELPRLWSATGGRLAVGEASRLGPALALQSFEFGRLGRHMAHRACDRVMSGLIGDESVHLEDDPPIGGMPLG